MSIAPDKPKPESTEIRKYNSRWAFTRFERRALWVLSLFLISGTALRMYHNHQLTNGLELIPIAESNTKSVNEIDLIVHSGISTPINVNSATQSDLERLPGIGPVKALAIIDHIKVNGLFNNPADIQNVKGIGPATFRKIEEYIVALP